MKKNFLMMLILAVSISFFSACKSEKDEKVSTDLVKNPATADTSNIDKSMMPVMTFDQDSYDFGDVKQGEKVTHNFQFTNTGKTDLIITSARASCGCTVPEYPKEPVKPGEKSIIKVIYNSEGRRDAFNKTVTITANTYPNENKLQIKGVVIVPNDK